MTHTAAIAAQESAKAPGRLGKLFAINPVAAVSAVFLLLAVVAVYLAPVIAPYDPLEQNLLASLQGPSSAHPLGTDSLGRDTLSRMLFGGQSAFATILAAVSLFAVLGLVFGILAGFVGGWVDRLISSAVDISMSLPGIIIILAVLAVFSQNVLAAMLTAAVLTSGSLIRVVRGNVLAIRDELYVAAARVSGFGPARIMGRHVLPGIVGPVTVQLAFFSGGMLGLQTGLGFLGLGSVPPTPTWGGMVGEAAPVMFQAPFFLLVTGGFISLLTLAFALLGDGIRDLNESRTQGGGDFPVARAATAVAVAPGVESGVATEMLSVRDYTISFFTPKVVDVVHGISFSVDRGEIVGLVGESGSGKTVTGMSLLGLLPPNGAVTGGGAWLDGVPLVGMNDKGLRTVRGRRIALVSQEPMVALDPLFTVGSQLDEVLSRLTRLGRREREGRSIELLESVGLPDATKILRRYPHELSGGMLQRVCIATALAGDPELIIADEPTTALDVTVQAGILDLFRKLRDERGLAVLLITHDLAVVADICDRVLVMSKGVIVERAEVEALFEAPQDEYTKVLIRSTPSLVELS